ncbi:hypothetical protein QEN19_000480 [Hanseniaspora menglaensis]
MARINTAESSELFNKHSDIKKFKVRTRFRIPPPVFQGFKRRFYCLYCKTSYKGTPRIISNHNSAHSHKNNVKTYYFNKFLQMYDRSYLKANGKFKLANDFNRFENTLLNNKKFAIQYKNEGGDDPETGSDLLSKITLLCKNDEGVPSYILRRRTLIKQREKQKIKDKINRIKVAKNKIKPFTNKDRQQLHEAKQILKQLNSKKRNSYKKLQLGKKRKKLLKMLTANTDSNLNLNFTFGGARKTKYDHQTKDNSFQLLNHVYKKSPNYNRVFLSDDQGYDIWSEREEFINKFNENLKAKKLKSLKTKIGKVKKRIQIKRKFGKRKFNPNVRKLHIKSQSEDRKWLNKFDKNFTDENYLKYLNLNLKHVNKITSKRKLRFDKRSSNYKLFNEDIKPYKFLQQVQQEKNKYTSALLLPPRTLNLNSNNLNSIQKSNSELISFPLSNKQKQQKMGAMPEWLLKHSQNKLLSRKLFFPQKKDLEGIPSVIYNYLNKSKKLKHLIKQALYKQQDVKSMFKYQGYLWKNYRKRNSVYKLNNNILQKTRIIKLLQLKSMGKRWFRKIYGKREGSFKKLQRLTRFKQIKDKKLKFIKKKKYGKKEGAKSRFNNGKKITPVKQKDVALKTNAKTVVTKPLTKIQTTSFDQPLKSKRLEKFVQIQRPKRVFKSKSNPHAVSNISIVKAQAQQKSRFESGNKSSKLANNNFIKKSRFDQTSSSTSGQGVQIRPPSSEKVQNYTSRFENTQPNRAITRFNNTSEKRADEFSKQPKSRFNKVDERKSFRSSNKKSRFQG